MGIQTHVEDLEPVSWALMALAILLVIVRLTIRYTATHQLRTEDIMVGVALVSTSSEAPMLFITHAQPRS